MGRHFDARHEEEIELADGSRFRLRLLRPSDRRKIVAGFQRLSAESRYRRFFTQLDHLPKAMLKHLTEVDGEDHVALGAARLDALGRERYIAGVARFIRVKDEPEVAEASVAVIDSVQRQGLGSRLCERLIGAASERGVKRFRCYLLGENVPVREMIRKSFPDLTFLRDGQLLVAELELPARTPDAPLGPQALRVLKMLRLAARGALRVRSALDRLRPR